MVTLKIRIFALNYGVLLGPLSTGILILLFSKAEIGIGPLIGITVCGGALATLIAMLGYDLITGRKPFTYIRTKLSINVSALPVTATLEGFPKSMTWNIRVRNEDVIVHWIKEIHFFFTDGTVKSRFSIWEPHVNDPDFSNLHLPVPPKTIKKISILFAVQSGQELWAHIILENDAKINTQKVNTDE